MTETDLSSLSVEEIFRFLESNNADVVAEVQAMFHQNLSQTKDGWLVVLILPGDEYFLKSEFIF